MKIPALVFVWLASGCSNWDAVQAFETVRFRQTVESADQDRRQAEHYFRELQSNNEKLSLLLRHLQATADGAEEQAQLCEQRARDHSVTLPAALLNKQWRKR